MSNDFLNKINRGGTTIAFLFKNLLASYITLVF